MSPAVRLERALDLNHALHTRACQSGPRGGRRMVLNLSNLLLAGFIERDPESGKHSVTPFFISYILEPARVIGENPGLHPTRIEMGFEEQIFYFMCHRNIVGSLKDLIADERTKAIKLPSEQRTRIIARYHRNIETARFWGHEFWTDLYTACVMNRMLNGRIPQKSVDTSNLARIGFLLSLRQGTLWQRVSRMFLLFIIDPGNFFENYPDINPLEELKGPGELHLYARIHVAVINVIERLVESGEIDQNTLSGEIVNRVYDLFQNASGARTN